MPTKCTAEGCSKTPRYNLPGQKGGIYCKECAGRINPDMVNVVGRKCETCGKTAVYNFADEKGKGGEGARFCKKHALPDMVNIVSKTCKKCKKIPCFNKPGEKGGLYCKDHAEVGMVDVTNRQCAHTDCTTSPTFNISGERTGKFCASHALPGMENVTAKRCLKCSKQARFNKPESTNGLYCAQHSEEGMIDVLCKRCAAEGCPTQPTYNWPGQRPVYCASHAATGMIDVKSLICHCGIRATYNLPGQRAAFCAEHADRLTMVDVANPRCSECGDVKTNSKYDGHCMRCFVHKFPQQKISRTYKVKETHVSDFLDKALEHTGHDRVFDRRVDGGCSLRRPDMYIDCLTHVVLQETDETQHRNGYSCENKRQMELLLDFGSRPIVFIRFNPDSYVDAKAIRQASCFKYHDRLHVPFVPSEFQETWQNRLDMLKQRLLHHISTIPAKEVTVEHLFYDGYE